ncbi:MAG: nickel pincer cofactor biosynthesis protein LarB [Planctomycetota bacterium]
MNRVELEQLAKALVSGEVSLEAFVAQAASADVADVGEAQVDLDRHRRCGFPEVVYAEGKTVSAMERIFTALREHGEEVLATRVSAEQAATLMQRFPDGAYNPVGRTFRLKPLSDPVAGRPLCAHGGKVVVVTAGTSDLPVAEEARDTALWTGAEVSLLQDVGVAGPHRLRSNLHVFAGADAVVVVAGMEGALPSVVGGYVPCPVVAVPTSVGYGASFGGLAALLGMLNSCASNVTVVNIDAGFKGGYVAGLIARNAARARAGAGGATVRSQT